MSPGVRRGRTASAQDLGQVSCNWKESRGGVSWRLALQLARCVSARPPAFLYHAVMSEKGIHALGCSQHSGLHSVSGER